MTRTITLITGGQRSGKSHFAETHALFLSKNPIYLATSRKWDDEYIKRIERHQKDRDERWKTIEEEKYLSQHNLTHQTIVIDCVTLWTTNFFFDNCDENLDNILQKIMNEFHQFILQDAHFIFVSNEIGLGGTPIDAVQRRFTDLLGWVNQKIAQEANNVVFMVSGLPMIIKGNL